MSQVSIAIPTHNRPEFLEQSIRSILRQIFQDFEILIFDDASDFSIPEFLSRFNDPRISFLRSSQLLSKEGNRGNFERITRYNFLSPYVLIFHDDDVMRPDFLEKSVALLGSNLDMAWTGSGLRFVSRASDMERFEPSADPAQPLICATSTDVVRLMLSGFHLCFDSVLYRREVLGDIGPFYDRFGKWCDRPFLVSLSEKGTVGIFPEALINYRVHSGQDSQTSKQPGLQTYNFNLYKYYFSKLPQPLLQKDRYLFYSFTLTNLIRSVPTFAGNFKQAWIFYKECRSRGLWLWRYLNPKSGFFFLGAFWQLFKSSLKND